MTGSLPHTLGYFAHIVALGCGLAAIERFTRAKPASRVSDLLLTAGCLVMGLVSFLASDPPDLFQDFRIAYYAAGRAVLTNPAVLHSLFNRGVSGFVNLPATAYLFAPFGALPFTLGAATFTALGLASVYAAWRLLGRLAGLDRTGRWRLALLFAANGPLVYSVREGNLSHVILLALVAGLILLRQARPGMAGIVLGAAAVLKPPLVLMGLVFLLRRDGRGLGSFAATGAVAVAASLLLFGWAENLHWFEACIVTFNHQWLGAFNVQSISAFLLRLTGSPAELMDWEGQAPGLQVRILAELLVGAVFAAAAWALLRSLRKPTSQSENERPDLTYLLAICLCLLASPLAWSHYYAWLLMPAAFLLRPQPVGAPVRWTAVLLISPLVWPLNPASPALMTLYQVAWSSHLLLGGLMVFGIVAWRLASLGEAITTAASRLATKPERRQMT